MLMKKLSLLIIAVAFSVTAFAQEDSIVVDDITRQLSQRVEALETKANQIIQGQAAINANFRKLDGKVSELTSDQKVIDSLVQNNELAISTLSAHTFSEIEKSNAAYQEGQAEIGSALNIRTTYGIIICAAILAIAILAFAVLRKRITKHASAVEAIKDAQSRLHEESIRLDEKLLEILGTQMKIQEANSNGVELDHSLALKVADELVRIETNLSRMDTSIRGYKQLSASLRRIKDNYLANGYEIIDMMGKPYNEGMKVIANFVPDDTLPEGAQIITGIVKPQINYKGKMIQAAQITVSQN